VRLVIEMSEAEIKEALLQHLRDQYAIPADDTPSTCELTIFPVDEGKFEISAVATFDKVPASDM